MKKPEKNEFNNPSKGKTKLRERKTACSFMEQAGTK